MKRYDVVIVGGGVAGLTCALTLASSNNRAEWSTGRRYLVLDNGSSDLLKAKLNNVPGIPQKTEGRDVIGMILDQVKGYENVDMILGTVVEIRGEKGNYEVMTLQGSKYAGDIVVLTTGFHRFDIGGLDVEVMSHKRTPKTGKVMIKTSDDGTIKEGCYAAGLLSGISSMYAAAAGSGSQIACNILSQWAGKSIDVHDISDFV